MSEVLDGRTGHVHGQSRGNTSGDSLSQTPDPSPFTLEGGPVGMLLLHGFLGSPAEMRLIGRQLNHHGVTVAAPCLPGHGTTVRDLNAFGADDWLEAAREAFEALSERCDRVLVGGFSLGASLALKIASSDDRVAGVVAYAPVVGVRDWRRYVLPLLKRVFHELPKPPAHYYDPETASRYWRYDTYPASAAHEAVKFLARTSHLAQVKCPALVIHSTADRTAHPTSATLVIEGISSPDKRLVTLNKSGHIMTLDGEWEQVAKETLDFLQRVVK